MGSRVDIAEYRRDLLPLERVRRGNESKRRHDDFAREAERSDGDLQSNRGIAHGDAVSDANECGKFGLELLDIGTIVREPVTVQHVSNARQETLRLPIFGRPTWTFSANAGGLPKIARSNLLLTAETHD